MSENERVEDAPDEKVFLCENGDELHYESEMEYSLVENRECPNCYEKLTLFDGPVG